jgi:type IV pilus assembly protein PilV
MSALRHQAGALMIEVLITIMVLIIGLLGLMQLQSRLQKSEVESYQRSQALMLAKDMSSRLSTNRVDAANYIIGSTSDSASLGGANCPTDVSTLQKRDVRDWCLALKGAAEKQGTSNVGTLINGRGCIHQLDGGSEYLVTVAWQGLTPISPAPANICAANTYDGGPECINDLCRRTVSTIVRLGTLPP